LAEAVGIDPLKSLIDTCLENKSGTLVIQVLMWYERLLKYEIKKSI